MFLLYHTHFLFPSPFSTFLTSEQNSLHFSRKFKKSRGFYRFFNTLKSFSKIFALTTFSFFFREIAFSIAYSSAKQLWSFLSSSSIACARKKIKRKKYSIPPRTSLSKFHFLSLHSLGPGGAGRGERGGAALGARHGAGVPRRGRERHARLDARYAPGGAGPAF